MGASGEDIILSPLAQEYFPFSSECKNTERLNIWKTLEQAFANETDDRPGIAIFKRNYSDIYATLRLSDFLNVLRTLADQRHELETLANLRNNN